MTVRSAIPTLADAFADALRQFSDGLRVCLPVEVVAWDAGAPEVATVRPTVRLLRRDVSGALLSYRPPPISNVPVSYPGAGDYAVTWPLSPGDTGHVVFADRSLDEWVQIGEPDSDPLDRRRHAYADAVFLPGIRPLGELPTRASPPSNAVVIACPTGGQVRLGAAAASSAVALAPLTEADLNTLKTAIGAAPVVPGDGGAAFKASLVSALAAWPTAHGAARVRAE